MNKPLTSVEEEIAAEQGAALGRSGRKLRAALDDLASFDAQVAARSAPGTLPRWLAPEERAKLAANAAETLWSYVVQREAMGLLDAEYIRKEYGVPPEIWRRMGPRR